ncbi:MAG: 3-isopropylmalate dehydratase large subunit [Theionarchaea archaeon]|nr:3-isopropylmalate dehydratase large subunit [Theionarchaea archaeon]MBU7037753.1 3-isopropylmalate dehydratase large subunit [Theionarchaea archaeon]
MPTLVETIVSKHKESPVRAGDEIEELPVDRLLINDVAAVQLVERYREIEDLLPAPFDPSSVFVVLDHVVPPCDSVIADNLQRTKQFARTLHLNLFKEGEGIEHVLLPENNLVSPGDILLGTDSHTCTNGALGCFAFGIGITDALFVLFTGTFYNFVVPETVLLTCSGKLQKGVYAKDLILYVLSHLDQQKMLNKVLQFSGPVFASMPLDGMLTVCNMTTEISAKTGIMPYETREDLSAEFAERYTFDVTPLEPVVAVPHSPLNGKPVAELTVEITKAFLGSCTNSRLSDLQVAASILRGKKVKDTVDLYIVPGSRKIYEKIQESGILSTFIQAGAVILPPNCAACFGRHMGVLGPSDVCISSANRNFVGRMGSKDAKVYLGSPATVAASALTGMITDPREVLP